MATVYRRTLRALVEATGSWIHFERLCSRDELFSESYLSYPVGQVLLARFGSSLRTEYEHPTLAPLKTGRGDKPRIDFAVVNAAGEPQLAVETKWLSSAGDLVAQALRDLLRLELLANRYGTECLFLLAGTQRNLCAFTEDKYFLAHPNHANSRSLLPYGERKDTGSLWLDTNAKFRRPLLTRALSKFKGIEVARALTLRRIGPYPVPATLDSYTAVGWRVAPRVAGGFLPESRFEFDLRRTVSADDA